MRIVPILLLALAAPLGAEPPAAADRDAHAIPQPVVLDWGDDFRLYAPPKNLPRDRMKAAEAAATQAQRPQQAQIVPPSHAAAALDADDRSTTRTSYRRLENDEPSLNLQAPVPPGPVSVGASYSKYRVVPDTNGVSSQDVRVSLGVAF
jgi:hypothetical protein